MRVLFDSNVWVSALQFGGTPLRAIAQALESETILSCAAIRQEVVLTMNRRFGRPTASISALRGT